MSKSIACSQISIVDITDGSSLWTTTVAPTTPDYTFAISNLDGDSETSPKEGDVIFYSTFRYTITSVSDTTVLAGYKENIKGDKGDTGTSVSSITQEYYLSDSKTTQSGGSWVETPPDWVSGHYLWTRSKIVYINPSSTVYTKPVCDSSWEAINDVEVGGENLFRKSSIESYGTIPWVTNGSDFGVSTDVRFVDGTKTIYIDCTTSTAGIHAATDFSITVRGGHYYTYSIWMYSSNTVNIGSSSPLHMWVSTTKGGTAHLETTQSYNGTYVENQWFRVTRTVKIDSSEDICYLTPFVYNPISSPISTGAKVYIAYPKIEEGNVATDWSPNTEDLIINERTLYYLKSPQSSTPIAPSSVVTSSDSITANQWSTVIQSPQNNYEYYTCIQYQNGLGAYTWSEVTKSSIDTIIAKWCSSSDVTYIDGGNIYSKTVTTSQLATDAIKSINPEYQRKTGVVYSTFGSLFDLSNGNIYTPNFSVISSSVEDMAVGAYLNGEIIATSGSIGNDSGNKWNLGNINIASGETLGYLTAVGSAYIQNGKWQISDGTINTQWYENKQNEGYKITYPYYNETYYDYGINAPILDSSSNDFYNETVSQSFLYVRNHKTTIPTELSDWNYVFRVDKDGNVYANNLYVNGTSISTLITDGVKGGAYLSTSGGTVNGSVTITGSLTATASAAIADSQGNTIISTYMKQAGTNANSATNTFTGTNTFSKSGGFIYSGIESGTTNYDRSVWFGDSTQVGKPVYSSKFKYNPASDTLTVGHITALVSQATSDGDGNTISSTYLKLSGGTLTGDVTYDSETKNYYKISRKKSDGGGWAYAPIQFKGNDDTIFANLGVYGNNDELKYIYLGASTEYNSTTNMRISTDGTVTAPKFSGALSGNATSADKINTNAGSTTQPVYFSNGVPVATTYALNKTVPSDAVFTDHQYTGGTGITLSGSSFNLTSGIVTTGTYRSVTVDTYGRVISGTNPTTISGYGITDAKIDSGTITLGSNTITPLTASSTLDATKLSGTIPSDCYTNTTYSEATTASAGLLSASDKSKLDSLNVDKIGTVTASSIIGDKDIHVEVSDSGVATITHSNSAITAGTVGSSSATSGSTLDIPYVTYDAYGHITGTGTHTHTVNGFLTSDSTLDATKLSGTASIDTTGNATTSTIATWIKNIDARTYNFTPNDYMTTYGKGLVTEFKFNPKTDSIPSSNVYYSTLMTISPWNDNSGGRPIQLSFNTDALGYRASTDDSTWGEWNTILHSGNYSTYVSPKAGSSDITTVGTITSGTWNGSKIANDYLANSKVTIGTTDVSLGGTTTSLSGLTSVTATTFTGALSGNATSADSATKATQDSDGNQINTSYLKLSGGTMTGTISHKVNTLIGNYRPDNTSYTSGLMYQTNGNEALVWANKNAVTSFMFLTGQDPTTMTSGTFTTANPAMQIKNNSVYINELIASGATPTYKFSVKGDSNITGGLTLKDSSVTTPSSNCKMVYSETTKSLNLVFS